MTPARNTAWMVRVRELLGQGLGVEDIAIITGCQPDDVRREIQIYREEGRLMEIIRPKVKS